jgi:LysM repeat protein
MTKKRIHVVQPGDSLSKIAREVYGDGSRWREIFEANRDKVSDPSRIYPGQELCIPYGLDDTAPATGAPTEPLPAEIPAERVPAREGVYVVQSGDSLSKIAKEVYGDGRRWPEIFEANKDKISDPGMIYPGQELRIPYRPDDTVPPTETPTEPLPTEPPTELAPTEPPVEEAPAETPTEPPPQLPGEIAGESYGDFSVNGDPTNPPAEKHPDLNLAMRGYKPINARKGLVDYSGGADPNAPQLSGLFADKRPPTFSAVYQVYGWDWERKRRGSLVTDPEVTMAGLAAAPGETIHVPNSGYSIGGGHEVLVLYATLERITLKYTPDDHVIWGYTLHVENIHVEPRLLALYQSWNEAGRGRLPALRAGQAFGRARGDEIGVVIRDRGAFMDPRSRKDWWQGW